MFVLIEDMVEHSVVFVYPLFDQHTFSQTQAKFFCLRIFICTGVAYLVTIVPLRTRAAACTVATVFPHPGRGINCSVRHGGGRMKKINAWYLNTHMVYL